MARFKSITFNVILDKIKNNKALAGGRQQQLDEFKQQLEVMSEEEIKTLLSAVYMSLTPNAAKLRVMNAAKEGK
jgi:hypothetical protein